ncbi:TPR repeat-containing protein YfgC precursor [Lacunisphaera limnophila]|uniref:TPR repeat-containing protein YfgC n=1 Tax=Lacunisphaera limnophila TaxID=1838286 RepID=A0A1D8AY82_9BACT|nr:M48 family metallopeptidase [Lacunisphaera limnophila]AOS45853.1 TPR repeat-containing protein YfgC precursor [Lacunisphaera limnophila]
MKSLYPALLAAVLLVLVGCYTVPETGRKSLMIVSPGEEMKMGVAAFADIRTKEKVSTDVEANARVRRIGTRIAEAVGNSLPGAQWEFVVFDEAKTVNAFALPGGKVGVYTGLLALASSDDEVATVIGHEIAHVTARHGAERMSQGLVAGVVGAGVELGTKDSEYRDLARVLYGATATGATLAFSRGNESEADYIGLRYAAKAGYDPRAAITFWQKMAKAKDGKQPWKWISTHPPDGERIAALQKWMPEVLPLYEKARARY